MLHRQSDSDFATSVVPDFFLAVSIKLLSKLFYCKAIKCEFYYIQNVTKTKCEKNTLSV